MYIYIYIQVSFETFTKRPVDNKPGQVEILDWQRSEDRSLSEPMTTYVTDAYMSRPPSLGIITSKHHFLQKLAQNKTRSLEIYITVFKIHFVVKHILI